MQASSLFQPPANHSQSLSHQINIGVVPSSSGSCYISMNSCQILANVNGPRMTQGTQSSSFQPNDESMGILECEVKFSSSQIDESTSSMVGSGDNNPILNYERQLSAQLKDAITASILLEKYPKSTIFISVLILSKKNVSDLAVSITSSSLALADAGIQLKDIVTAVHIPASPSVQCSLTLAEMGRMNELTSVLLEGSLDESNIQTCIQAGRVECAKLRTIIDEYTRDALKKA